MATPYANPEDAQQGLTSAFAPTNEAQAAAIKNAASLVPGATSAPVTPSSTPSPYYSRYTKTEQQADDYLNTFQKPESENQIVARKTAAAQGQIDALNRHYDNLLGEQKVINEGRDRSTQAVNVMSGLAGSTEANVQQGKTTTLNQADNKRIQDERNLQIQTLLTGIRTSAVKEAQEARTEARLSAQAVMENRAKRQTEAVGQLTQLAQSGVTATGFKATDPQGYAYLAKALGGEEQVKAMFTLNRPQETILDKKIEGGKYIISYQNPLDGKIRIETLDLGLPDNYTKTIDAGDRILAMPENWDGDPSKLITINKGLTPSQAAEGGGEIGDNPQLYSGLSSKTATAVRSKVGAWKSEGVVTNFATIQEGRNFAGSLSDDTTNPSDDQGLIYALAKALDPGSVVREGEYATAQKYSQSLIDAYGKGVTQAINGTGFLSKQARRNIKDTIEARYQASKQSYTALQSQYEQGINALTGRSDGGKFLTDYTAAPLESSSNTVIAPDGTEIEIVD